MPANLLYRPRLADLNPLRGGTHTLSQLEAAVRNSPVSDPVTFERRLGYDAGFLSNLPVPWPTLTETKQADILPAGAKLDYMHFSVAMSRSRRMALFVGVNIDGQSSISIPRGNEVWRYDGRLPKEAQFGNELYAGNLLDRGHLVRREDPNWGGDDAQTANEDTFHFTNSVPQMAGFNQKTWLSLENYVLKNARSWQDRITVFSGPVFRESDREYRGARIPEAFWKVIAFLSDDGSPSATAYIIAQTLELGQLEATYGAFKTYQCSVRSIEDRTGIDFGMLRDFDGFSNEEDATGVTVRKVVNGAEDILV